MCRVPGLDFAAVEKDVDAVTIREDGGDERRDGGGGGEVSRVDESFAAERFDMGFDGEVRRVSLLGLIRGSLKKGNLRPNLVKIWSQLRKAEA